MADEYPVDPEEVFGADQQCFACGPHNPNGLQLKFRREGDEVVADFVSKPGQEGAPGVLHGGLQATLCDEVGAYALIGMRGRFGFTTTMNLRYYRPARMGVSIEARSSILSESDQHALVKVTLRQEGKRLMGGKISYAKVTRALAEKMLGQELPEAWRHLTADHSHA